MGLRDKLGAMVDRALGDWLVLADRIIRQFEGCERKTHDGFIQAYPDPATGGRPYTIGWGSTGPDVTKGIVWTQATCDARLLKDLQDKFGPGVDKLCAGVPTPPHQKAAMVSFAYNVGLHNLEESTLLRKHRDGNPGAADEFLKWTYANHKHMPGLVKRRTAERALYLGKPQ